jgi:hypothetical protein
MAQWGSYVSFGVSYLALSKEISSRGIEVYLPLHPHHRGHDKTLDSVGRYAYSLPGHT